MVQVFLILQKVFHELIEAKRVSSDDNIPAFLPIIKE